MTSPRPPAHSPDQSTAKNPRKIDLDVTQVSASALAAITAAILGSQLGAVGTIGGAAAGSIITTVGTGLYQHSLERSRERVRQLALRTKAFPVQRAVDGTTPTRPHGDPLGARVGPASSDAPTERIVTPAATPARTPLARRRPTLRWTAAVAGSLGAFFVAMMLISGFELTTGKTVGGNGDGLTVVRVAQADPGPAAERPAEPAPAPSTTPEDGVESTTPSTAPESTTPSGSPASTSKDVPTPNSGAKPTVTPQPTR